MNNRVTFWSRLEILSRKRHSSYSDLDIMEVIHELAEIKSNTGGGKAR